MITIREEENVDRGEKGERERGRKGRKIMVLVMDEAKKEKWGWKRQVIRREKEGKNKMGGDKERKEEWCGRKMEKGCGDVEK